MSVQIRVVLIFISGLTMYYIIKKIRESKLEIEQSLFWIGFSTLTIFMSIFPKCVYWLTNILQIQSPVNFVFLIIIFILIIKSFLLTLQLSRLENRFKTLVQEIALKEKEKEIDDDN